MKKMKPIIWRELEMIWLLRHPKATFDMLGIVPTFLNEFDPRPAREQLNDHYQHGGGWLPMNGFTMNMAGDLLYPGDPPLRLIAECLLHQKELVRLYECEVVVILQKDGSFEASRMD